MKVAELLTKLKSFPPNTDVICYTESENIQEKDYILDISDVSLLDATKVRMPNGKPSLKFEKSESSEPHVIISVISDF